MFFKSWWADNRPLQMKHAAQTPSAVPSYFEPALVPVGGATQALIDGGVFINSPSVLTYTETKKLIQTHKAEMETVCGFSRENAGV